MFHPPGRGAPAFPLLRPFLALTALAAMALAGPAGTAGPANPAVTTATSQAATTTYDRIVAVGDVHGDYQQLLRVLGAAGLVDQKGDWCGGQSVLVQTGDVIDRCDDSRKCFDLLMKLEVQAAQAGGAVHCLIGNHEVDDMYGDLRYLTEGELKSYGGAEGLAKLLGPDGIYGRWIRQHDTVLMLNGIIFCHGGLEPRFARLGLDKINQTIRQELAQGNRQALALAMDNAGPLWSRDLAVRDDQEVSPVLAASLKACGAAGMVIGHTVSRRGVCVSAGGRLIHIDVGMTGCFGGPASCLLIEKGAFYKVESGKKNIPLRTNIKLPAGDPATRPATRPAVTSRASKPAFAGIIGMSSQPARDRDYMKNPRFRVGGDIRPGSLPCG